MSGRLNSGAKEDLGRPASGEGHDCHAQSGVAPGFQQLCGGGDEGLRVEGDQIGLLLVDLLVVGAFELVCFLRGEREG